MISAYPIRDRAAIVIGSDERFVRLSHGRTRGSPKTPKNDQKPLRAKLLAAARLISSREPISDGKGTRRRRAYREATGSVGTCGKAFLDGLANGKVFVLQLLDGNDAGDIMFFPRGGYIKSRSHCDTVAWLTASNK
jgi:hypothetical protein